jgi:[NiFe] hydrogenase diaphorase moiety large subunit
VETFCKVARILECGPGWFAKMGSPGSKGTKLLSISGDCSKPGVYEVPFGIRLIEVLEMCGADDAAAVQMGGPSGQLVGPLDFNRPVCYDHLATGGSVMVFDSTRDLWDVVSQFLEFFAEESCGYCTPCRVGTVLMKERVDRILARQGVPDDLAYLERLATTVKSGSRCGLGQTSPNPVLSVLKSFPEVCRGRLAEADSVFQPTFDIRAALGEAEEIAGRETAYPWK